MEAGSAGEAGFAEAGVEGGSVKRLRGMLVFRMWSNVVEETERFVRCRRPAAQI